MLLLVIVVSLMYHASMGFGAVIKICFVLFWFAAGQFYSYCSGLLHWHWGNHMMPQCQWSNPEEYRNINHMNIQTLTQCGFMMPNGEIDLGQHWLRKWLVAWWHQIITLINVDFSLYISQFQWHSSEGNFTVSVQANVLHNEFENYVFKINVTFPNGQYLFDHSKMKQNTILSIFDRIYSKHINCPVCYMLVGQAPNKVRLSEFMTWLPWCLQWGILLCNW